MLQAVDEFYSTRSSQKQDLKALNVVSFFSSNGLECVMNGHFVYVAKVCP